MQYNKRPHCKRGHLRITYGIQRKNGFWVCKLCRKLQLGAVTRKNKQKIYQRKYFLMKNYGITIEEAQTMASKQNNLCPICLNILDFNSRHFHIDHNHITKQIRGILCHRCNTGIGLLRENIESLHRAISYLS